MSTISTIAARSRRLVINLCLPTMVGAVISGGPTGFPAVGASNSRPIVRPGLWGVCIRRHRSFLLSHAKRRGRQALRCGAAVACAPLVVIFGNRLR